MPTTIFTKIKPLSQFTLIAVLCVFFSTGCATMGSSADRQLAALRKQVDLVWTAKTQTQWATVWDNSVSAYQKRIPRDRFVSNAKIQVKDYAVKDLQLTAPGVSARAEVAYTMVVQGYSLPNVSQEEWLMENGVWRVNLLPALDANPFAPKPKQ